MGTTGHQPTFRGGVLHVNLLGWSPFRLWVDRWTHRWRAFGSKVFLGRRFGGRVKRGYSPPRKHPQKIVNDFRPQQQKFWKSGGICPAWRMCPILGEWLVAGFFVSHLKLEPCLGDGSYPWLLKTHFMGWFSKIPVQISTIERVSLGTLQNGFLMFLGQMCREKTGFDTVFLVGYLTERSLNMIESVLPWRQIFLQIECRKWLQITGPNFCHQLLPLTLFARAIFGLRLDPALPF